MSDSSKKGNILNPVKVLQVIFNIRKFAKVFGRLMRDRRVPWYAKAMPCLAIAYIISPIDLIPGLLVPIIGGLDDLIALFLGFKGLVSLTPKEIIDEHLSRIDQGM
ncbi:MAG: YkvA family protein [bacterium]